MKRMTAVGFALAVALLGPSTPSTALAQDRNASLSGNEMTQMDYGRGDQTERWRDRTRVDGIDLEGRWIIKRGSDWRGNDLPSDARSRWGSLQAASLPRRLVIDQRRNVIRLEDFRGRLVQQILIRDQNRVADRDGSVIGWWRDSKLVTVQSGSRNTRIIQTFELVNRGRTLVVSTRQDGRGTRHDVEFTNVYQRV